MKKTKEDREIHSLACEVYKSQGPSDYTDGCIDGFITGYKEAMLKWNCGEPVEYGEYLTIRENRRTHVRRCEHNIWLTPKQCNPENGLCPGWMIKSPDLCDITGWIKLEDIKL